MGKQEEELIHDLRNSAAVIKAAAAEMSEGLEDLAPEVLRQLTTMVQQRSDHVLQLLDVLTGEAVG
jgi:nitrogen-specific signal transduction histidine kinase